jgi:hypothetical protein
MMRSHRLGFGCVLLLAIFLAGMVTNAQGQSEPTLDVLRSGSVGDRAGHISVITQRVSVDQEGCDDLVI